MQVPPPCCRGCNKRVGDAYNRYWSVIHEEGIPDRQTVAMVLINRNSDYYTVEYSNKWDYAASGELDSLVDETIRDRNSKNYPKREELFAALGTLRSCCKNTIIHPPIAPVYHPVPPPSSKLQIDNGTRRRFLNRVYGKSLYYISNYGTKEDAMVQKLFPKGTTRIPTRVGMDAIDQDDMDTITDAINDLPDDL